ncbi:MAG: hypothetical protein ACTSRG_26195 [Candidatus Helarchaeota archaeon]
MPEIISPAEMRAFDYDTGKMKKCKPKDVADIELDSVKELMELAETYGVKIIIRMKDQYCFRYKKNIFYAKQ